MADFDGIIDPAAGWPDIPSLSVEALALGGPDGALNAQAEAIAARLNQLRAQTYFVLSAAGVKGDGVVDDTAAIQACADAGGSYYIPFGMTIRLTAPINVSKPVTFWGDGCNPYTDIDETSQNTRGDGAWFVLDHAGIGFNIATAGGASDSISMVRFSGCGTFRYQPTPGAGAYTAGSFDWDFHATDCEVQFQDFVALNPSKFFYGSLARGGRAHFLNVRGQPLQRGIEIDNCYDNCTVDAHFWPYWSLNTNVAGYTRESLIVLTTGRADGIMIEKLFCIWHNVGWLINNTGAGPVYRGHANWLYIDNGRNGIIVAAGADNATVHVDNLVVYGLPASNSFGLEVAANNLHMTVGIADFDTFHNQALYIAGTGNRVQINQPKFTNYGYASVDTPGIVCEAGNKIIFDGALDHAPLAGRSLFSGAGALITSGKPATTFYAVDFGAVGGVGVDSQPAIQAAIFAAQAAGGGDVILPAGIVFISSSLYVTGNNVTIIGAGSDCHHDVGTYSPATQLVWSGGAGGMMLEVTPTPGAGNKKTSGCGVRGVSFNGNVNAGIGLSVRSHNSGRFTDLGFFSSFSTSAIWCDVVATLGEARDTQHNVFDGITISAYDATVGWLITLGGDATANTSFNTFRNLSISHYNAHAIVLSNADNNDFFTTHIYRAAGGTGIGVIFAAGATEPETARVNHFFGLSTNAGVLAQAGAASSHDNIIYAYDKGNGSPDPTIQTGATLAWTTDTAVANGFANGPTGFGDNPTTALAARAAIGVATQRIRNDSNAHIVMDDSAGNAGAIRMVTKDIELLPLDSVGKTALVRPVVRFPTADGTIAGVLKNQVDPAIVSNTVTETEVFTYTIPANTMIGKKLKLRLHFTAVNAGDVNATTCYLNGYLGGVAMWTANTALQIFSSSTNSADKFHGFVDIEICPDGDSSHQAIQVFAQRTSPASSAIVDGSAGAITTTSSIIHNSLTRDMTASQIISIKAKLSVALTTKKFTLQSAELILQ